MRLANIILALSLVLALAPLRPANAAYTYTPPPPDAPAAIGEAAASSGMPLAPEFSGCGGQLVAVVNAAYEQQVVDLVNAIRQQNGLPPLKRVDLLDEAARYHAADLAQDDYFSHDTYDLVNNQLEWVCSWKDRIASFYAPPGGPSYTGLAENIAGGQSDPTTVVGAWMNSPGHRANILSYGNWELGVGYYQGGSYGRYWVQDFGRRSGVYPLVINNDAASSTSRMVTLYIYGRGTFDEMRLRNDDEDWSSWQPFQSSLDWELSCGNGVHTVSVELRNAVQTTTSSDSIELSQSECTPTLGNLPDELYFSYSVADQALFPQQIEVQPQNTEDSQPLSWAVTTQGDWFSVQPQSGTTPAILCITPKDFDDQKSGVYTGTLTISVTGPSVVAGSPKMIDLRLLVYPQAVQRVHLPYLTR
jgi:uncharacterized protein YkwD